jgi:hypothetical protein
MISLPSNAKVVIVKPRKMRWPRPPRGCRAIGDEEEEEEEENNNNNNLPRLIHFVGIFGEACDV